MKFNAQLEDRQALRNVAKLLMNSMYGRFGMHTEPIRDEIITLERRRQLMRELKVIKAISLGGLESVSYTLDIPISQDKLKGLGIKRSLPNLPGQTNVPIAAAITEYTRMIIYHYKLDVMNLGLKVYFSDTDFLVLDGPLPLEYCDKAELGKFKLEHKFKEESLFLLRSII